MLSFLGRGRGGGGRGGDASTSASASAGGTDPPGIAAAAATAAAADDVLDDGAAIEIVHEATLEGHTAQVWCVAWEPHGRSLATCSSDKTVRLWAPSRAAGGAWVTVAELEGVHNRTVRTVAWSPCGRLLATASFDASTAVWVQQGGEWECVAVVEGHENEVKGCAWSPSGTLLATCGRDKSVWIWELHPGNDFECVSVLNGHTQDVKQVTWHPTEDVLVSVSYDNTVKVWEEDPGSDDWSCAHTITAAEGGHDSTVWSVAFEPGGERRAVTCSDDRTIATWNAKGMQGMELSVASKFPCGHDRPVLSVSWGKAGLVAAAGGDNSLRVYAAASGEKKKEKKAKGGVAGGGGGGGDGGGEGDRDLNRDGWREVGAVVSAHDDDVNCVAWHPNERHTLASCSDDGTVKVWSVRRR